jgi:hypothetical protein
MTRIHIQIDSREWDFELLGRATTTDIEAAIRDITSAYPNYMTKEIRIEDTSWSARHLAPLADAWLSANPVGQIILAFVGGAMVGVAIWLNM